MEITNDVRRWDEMLPEVLSQIFKDFCFKDKLTLIPLVCKPWRKVVVGPECWREIYIDEWCELRAECGSRPRGIHSMIHMLVSRGGGSMTKLFVFGIRNKTLSFISENANALETLRLRCSGITDSTIKQTIGRFSNLTFLDISHCAKIGSRSLKAIGVNCKFLTGLCRNIDESCVDINSNDETDAIATTMPGLKYLEMEYHGINTQGALQILENCPVLKFFDLIGCYDVQLDDNFLAEKFPKVEVVGPSEHDDSLDEEVDDMSISEASDEDLYKDDNGYEDLQEMFVYVENMVGIQTDLAAISRQLEDGFADLQGGFADLQDRFANLVDTVSSLKSRVVALCESLLAVSAPPPSQS